MNNPLQEQTNSHLAMIYEDINKGQQRIFDGLVTNVPVNRIPEHIFRDYFLPSFLGKNPNPNWSAEWISIAGTPSSSVAVIDTDGNELFRVPGLIASTNVLLTNKTRGTMNDIFNHAVDLGRNSDAKAQAFVNGALNQKAQEALGSIQTENIAVWQGIYARYGINQTPQAVPTSSQDQDMFEY